MAQFTFTNNTYAGEALAGFMGSTLLEADSVKRGLWTVVNDVKARKIILDADDDAILQDPSGMFHDQGTTAQQTESYLDPVVYEFMKQEQWDKLIQTWENQTIKPGSMQDYDGDVDLTDFMIERYMLKLQIANERLYYLGKSASPVVNQFTAAFPGLLKQVADASGSYKVSLSTTPGANMDASAISASGVVTVADTTALKNGDVVSIVVSAGAITETTNVPAGVALLNQEYSYFITILSSTTFKLTRNYNDINTRKAAAFSGVATAAKVTFINAGNVLSVMGSIYAQLDPADRAQEDFRVQIPLHVSYAYKSAQAAAAAISPDSYSSDKKMQYIDLPLEIMKHWKANTILGARTSNIFLGVDLLGDESELLTVDLRQATGDSVVRMKARMKAATNFKFANELFLLSA